MSRNEKYLREICAKHKIYVESLKWTPVGKCMEMCGREGGWILNDFTPIGLSTEEAAKYLDEHPDHFEKIEPYEEDDDYEIVGEVEAEWEDPDDCYW